MRRFGILAVTAALMIAGLAPTTSSAESDDPHQVIELRQYKIAAGKRDMMIALFERNFIESQEALGMRLVGQFRDRADPSLFTWIRAFPSMEMRGKALGDFYFGPVWQAHRAAANALLDDNDDVLLLRTAWPGSGFAPAAGRRAPAGAEPGPAGMIVATIEYLWKDPGEGYSDYFRDRLAPAYRAAGLPILAAYLPEKQPNNFPRLHVRQGERVFVWFTRVSGPPAYAAATRKLQGMRRWRSTLEPALADFREREPQLLMLSPTPRSLLR